MLWLIFALFSILYVLHISQSLHIVTLPSKISFKVFINSSSSSIKCISTLLGKRHSNVFSAKSLDEKEISDKYRGVPLNKEVHKSVIENVIKSFKDNNYYINNLTSSPIKGGNGNIEYLAYFKRDKERSINVEEVVNKAFK